MHNLRMQSNEEREDLFSIPITFPTLQSEWSMIERICSHHDRFQRRKIRQTEEAVVTKCSVIDLNRFQMGTVADGVVPIGSFTVLYIIKTIHIRKTPSPNYHSLHRIQSIKLKGASGQEALLSNHNRLQLGKSLQNKLRSIIIVACIYLLD